MSKKKPEITETNKEEITSETVLQAESTELEKLEKELAETKDSLLRLAAEYDNFRKRTAKEKLQAHGDAKASVLVELLPVLDNFDRALDKGVSDSEAFQKGIEMTYNQLVSTLGSLGVESFGEKGDTFDPLLHNAVMHTQSDELPENTLAEIFLKGYKIGDKVLRCADVQVAN